MEKNDNNFVITSRNCYEFDKKLFGYAIYRNEIYLSWRETLLDVKDWDLVQGEYVALYKEDEVLHLRRDNMGLIRLYFFSKDGYWAISNSFWGLCEQIKEEFELTLNLGYAEALMAHSMTAFVPFKSLSNEIKVLSIFDEVEINLETHNIQIANKFKLGQKLNLDSELAFEEIDKWISYWGSLAKSIEMSGYNFEIDLSGGYDSRVSYAIAKAANVDFSKPNVLVYSVKPEEKGAQNHFSGDYEIAEKIANMHNIKVTSSLEKFGGEKISTKDRYTLYQDTISDCMNEIFDRDIYYTQSLIKWGGYLGETVRGYESNYWKRGLIHRCCINDGVFHNAVPMKTALQAVLEASIEVQEIVGTNENDSREIALQYTIECLDGAFFGKQIQQYQRLNILCMSPFMDISLRKINVEKNYRPDILFAVILARICPELLEVPYSSEAGFTKKEIEYVLKLNEKYPSKIRIEGHKDIVNNERINKSNPYNINMSEEGIRTILIKNFNSEKVCETIHSKFGEIGEKMYEFAEHRLQRDVFQNETYAAAINSIVKMIQIEKESSKNININEENVTDDVSWNELKKLYPEYSAIDELQKYVYESDQMEKNVNFAINSQNKKIYLYGAGECARELAQRFSNAGREIEGFIVSEKTESVMVMGKPVIEKENIKYDKDDMIILPAVSILYFEQVKRTIADIEGR